MFYINLPVGILAFLGLLAFLPETERATTGRSTVRLRACSASAIGALQLMLDRGEQLGLVRLARDHRSRRSLGGLGFYLFVVHTFTGRAARSSTRSCSRTATSSTGLIFIFVVGIILLATLALLPPFLQNLMGYPVLTAGLVLAPRGVGTMVAMFLVGRLIGQVDARA